VGTECFGKVLHQRCKKLLARFRCGPFEDRAQGSIGFEILKRLEAIKGRGGPWTKVWNGAVADSRGNVVWPDLVGEPEKSLQVEIPFQRGFYRLDMIASRHGVLHDFAPAGRA
jgi:hypothetical protein